MAGPQMRVRCAPAEDLDRVLREAAADIAAVRARSLDQRQPASVETTPAQARDEDRGVVVELRPGGREQGLGETRRTEQRRSMFAGLKLGDTDSDRLHRLVDL